MPAIPGLSLVGLVGLRWWRALDGAALWAFGIYAIAQQMAALLSPNPGLASITALLRSLLLLGLLGLGARLGSGRRLWPLVVGVFAVGLTALFTSAYGRVGGVFAARLSHPYMTEVSLGILGVLGALLSPFIPVGVALQGLAFLGSAALLILSGSRGPLLMLGAGLLVLLLSSFRGAAHVSRRPVLVGLTALLLVSGIGLALHAQTAGYLSRFLTFDSTGRDLIWLNVLSTIRHFPVGGVGEYLLGNTLADPVQSCTLWPVLAEAGYTCPDWLSALGQPWLIAHNGILQQLGEGGVIGTAGLLLLLGRVLAAARQRRDAAASAVIAAVLTGSLLDNTFIVPSPFFAEVFWLAAGIVLAARRPADVLAPQQGRKRDKEALGWRPVLWGAALLIIMGFPLFASRSAAPAAPLALSRFSADRLIVAGAPYRVYARVSGVDGPYRLALRSCQTSCQTVAVQVVDVHGGSADVWLQGQVPAEARSMDLLLLPAVAAPWRIRPLAQRTWNVEIHQ